MKSSFFDCVIIGLGAMGSSTAYQLAKRNKKILGLEQFHCAHALGSSHGETRLIRKAYFEHPDYVPLLERSYQLWEELENRSNKRLLHKTGLAIFGEAEKSEVLKGVKASAEKYHIPVELWDAEVCKSKFSVFNIPGHYQGVFEPSGGYLEVENCVQTFCEEAQKLGAQLQFNEKVLSWRKTQDGFEIKTSNGFYFSDKLILTAGPWMGRILQPIAPFLNVHRAPLFWFASQGKFQKEKGMPCFAFDTEDGFFYGFTEKEGYVKLALHRPLGLVENPETESREILEVESQPVKDFVEQHLKGISSLPEKSALCFYTLSPDSHFLIDKVPEMDGAYFAAGFSGHGFKFTSLVGEVLADWVTQERTKNPVEFLKLNRLRRS